MQKCDISSTTSELKSISLREIGLKKALQSIAFVPRGGEKRELAKPSELFKPNSHELRDLLSARDFPCKEFCGLDVLGSLEDLGLQSKISRENILEIARHIETSARTCKEDDEINRLAQRSARLTEYIVAKQNSSNSDVERKMSQSFNIQIGSNNEEVQKQERSDREYFNAICEIEFIPVLRVHSSLQQRQTSSRFCSAQDASSTRHSICSVKSISALRTTDETMKIFRWDRPVDAVTLGLQLVSIARMHENPSEEICDVIRTIYKKLNEHVMGYEKNASSEIVTPSTKQDETIERVKVDFATLRHTVDSCDGIDLPSLRNVAKWFERTTFLFTVPSRHTVSLFQKFGVRETFATSDYVSWLKSMSKAKKVTDEMIDVSIRIANHLSDDPKISDFELFLPDTSGEFAKSIDLFVDDMTWSQNKADEYRLVHEKIGLKIARRLGVKSLRETMVLDSSESFGVPFGQKECLTRRLSNILEQYPQGITPFLEFIQNADDAGARNVKIVRAIRNSQHKFI